ncbi:MAG TPA: helicase-related protein [Gemmatimonadaceae bacterium]|nr:helicase-related protein [Gemmatimonadaceae bacterium]
MAHTLRLAPPAEVLALIARLWSGEPHEAAKHGTIVLRPHQRSALERLRRMLREQGGALLADDVGLGKTYVAAALARDYERVLVVAPSTLRAMWHDALRDVGATGSVVSYATLSRGGGPRERFDLVLLDEAHHARTPGTRRYARIAELADGAHVVLLSATPIHNSRRDLAALLALYLGARALALDDDALARHIIRRERDDVPTERIPETTAPLRLLVGDDHELLRAILALPPPLPPRDAGSGGALVVWGLVREWASSNAALVGALRRRLVRAGALAAALEGGRLPSRRELATWACDDRSVQLAFPELLDVPVCTDAAKLQLVLALHERGVRALLQRARASAWTDAARAQQLRDVRALHDGEKIVAFTQFADTARAIFREMRYDAGVAVLTARGASVAGGALSRSEAIARFAPRASGVRAPRAIERIDLLIATDLLSEGVNLHDASVVVHLDLPWTPARMEQRVGRSRRLGALHARTAVYAMQPPASSEALLGVEQRLRAKLGATGRLLGADGDILPGSTMPDGTTPESTMLESTTPESTMSQSIAPVNGVDAGPVTITDEKPGRETEGTRVSAARRQELVLRALECWRGKTGSSMAEPRASEIVAGTMRASASGLLALVREGDEYRLVAAANDGEVGDDTTLVLESVRLVSVPSDASSDAASALETRQADIESALDRVDRWASRRAGVLAAGADLEPRTQARKLALRRVASIAARAPRHRRSEITRLAALARQMATAPYGAGAERALEKLVALDMKSDEAWLRRLGDFGASRHSTANPPSAPRVEPVAILVLVK